MTRPALLLAACILACSAYAQTLLIMPETGDMNELHFNPLFIQRNGITTITGDQLVKRDGQPMREKKEKYLYRFNTAGLPVYSNNSFGQPGTGRDTASTTYTYDTSGRIMRRLRNDLAGHFAYENQLDDKGRVVRETYTRLENLGTDRYNLIPGKVTEISDEHFRYETLSDSITRKFFTNNHGLPFREQLFVKDKMGYLKRVEDRYLISNRRSLTTFRYDEKGRLAERVEQPNMEQPRTIKRVWRYDAAGNVIEGELWNDDRQIDREEYLYDEQTMVLKARLTKDLVTGVIHVVRFTTERR